MEENDERIEVLLRLFERNEKYHDHKENMAWLATAFYATYSGFLLKWLISTDLKNLSFITTHQLRLFGLIIFWIIAVCVFSIIYMHFTMRWYSADRSIIYRRYIFDLISSNEDIFDYRLRKISFTDDDSVFPAEFQEKIIKLKEKRKFIDYLKFFCTIPLVFPLFVKCNGKDWIDQRIRTEVPAYMIIFVPLFVNIAVLCIKTCK